MRICPAALNYNQLNPKPTATADLRPTLLFRPCNDCRVLYTRIGSRQISHVIKSRFVDTLSFSLFDFFDYTVRSAVGNYASA